MGCEGVWTKGGVACDEGRRGQAAAHWQLPSPPSPCVCASLAAPCFRALDKPWLCCCAAAAGGFVFRGGKLISTSVDLYMALEYCNQVCRLVDHYVS